MRAQIIALGTSVLALTATPHAAVAQDVPPAENPAASVFDARLAEAKASMMSDPSGAFEAAKAAEAEATSVKNGKAQALWLQAEALTRMGEPEQAISRITVARRLLTDDADVLAAELLLAEARTSDKLGDQGVALALYQDAYRAFDALGDARKRAVTLQGIARLYQDARRFDQALDNYEKAAAAYPGDIRTRFAAASNKARILRVLAPLGVLLPNGLGLNIDGKDIGRANFVRCIQDGCFAEVILDETLLTTMSDGTSATFIVFQTPEEGIGIPVDLDGFKDGFSKLP